MEGSIATISSHGAGTGAGSKLERGKDLFLTLKTHPLWHTSSRKQRHLLGPECSNAQDYGEHFSFKLPHMLNIYSKQHS